MGPGAEEWRRRHARRSYKTTLLVTTALAGAFGALTYVALLWSGAETREVVEQAVGFCYSPFRMRSDVIVLNMCFLVLMQKNIIRNLWNWLLEHAPV